MNIKKVMDMNRSVVHVGRVTEGRKLVQNPSRCYYDRGLEMDFNSKIPSKTLTTKMSTIYFICVDDKVMKIGQTMCSTGIKGAIRFYLSAGTDDPGINRFWINWEMRKLLSLGKKIDFYMFQTPKVSAEIRSMFSTRKLESYLDAKQIESLWVSDYEKQVGRKPKWNKQENGEQIPKKVAEEFGKYKMLRSRTNKIII